MADKRISQLVERTTLANNDVLPIVASGASTTNKVTLQTIEDWMQGNLNFGVTSVAISVPTGLTVTGSPITSTGTFIIGFAAGYSIPTNTKQSEWDSAYNDKINSVAVTGTTTKTITLTQQDGGTLSAQWSDLQPVTSVFGRTGDVVAVEGDYSLDQLSGVGITSPSSGQVLKYDGTNWVNATEQYVGTVTSVGVSVPAAFSVTGSPITTSGTITISGAGTSAQYIDGTGSLQTFPNLIAQATNLVREVYNNSGATMTKGTVVYINGGHGNLPTIAKAKADADSTSAQTYGVVQANISDQSNGYIVVVGDLTNIDTQGYLEGTQLYLSGTTAGNYTSTKPYAPIHIVYVGIVTRSHPTQGIIAIKIQNGYEMDEIHDVDAQNPSDNDILQYKTASGLWTKTAGTTTNIAEGTNLYYTNERARQSISETITGIDYDNTTGVFSTTSGYGIPTTAKQTQWDAAYNDKINSASVSGTTTKTLTLTQQDGGTITTSWSDYDTAPVTSVFGRTGAIVATEGDYNLTQLGDVAITTPTNGQFLKYDGTSWINAAAGTVTSVALATGTTGTDVGVTGSPITGAGTITLNIPVANATNTGKLSSTDWSTFNGKQNAITLTTTGTSGAATLVGSTLNVPNYSFAETDTLASVTGRGASTSTQSAFNGGLIVETKYQFNTFNAYGSYSSNFTTAGAETFTWLRLGNLSPHNLLTIQYRAGSSTSEENGRINVSNTCDKPFIEWTRNTYNYNIREVRARMTGGCGSCEIWVLVRHGNAYTGTVYMQWQVIGGTDPAFSAANTTGTPGTGTNEVSINTTDGYFYRSTGNIGIQGTITASNFSGSSSGTNTGDQDLSGYVTIATDQTITGVKTFRNTGSDTLVIRGVDAAGTQGQGAAVYLGGNDGTLDRNYAAIYARKENGTSGNPAGQLVFGVRHATLGVRDALTIDSSRNVAIVGNVSAANLSGTNTGDQTLAGLGGVPTSRTLTINGTALDLSANRSWSVGTVVGNSNILSDANGSNVTINGGYYTGFNPTNIPAGQSSGDWGVSTFPIWTGNSATERYSVQFAANIDANSSIFVRKFFFLNGVSQQAWYTLLHSGNFSSYVGSGTSGRLTKWSANGTSLSDASITDNGSTIRINTLPFVADSRIGIGVAGGDQTYASLFIGGAITTGTNQYALLCDPQLAGSQDNYAVFANPRIKANTAVTNTFGVYIPTAEKLSGATIVNSYALYIANQTSGSTLNYSIYSSGGQNYFGGKMGIGGTTSADVKLYTFASNNTSSSYSAVFGNSSGQDILGIRGDSAILLYGNITSTGTAIFRPPTNTTSSTIEFSNSDNAAITAHYSLNFACDNSNTVGGRTINFQRGAKGYGNQPYTMMSINGDTGHVTPGNNGTQNLGSASFRWATVFTSDLDMSNGIGDYTIVEGYEDLFLYNNNTGKVFKFNLTEVDKSVAPPKKLHNGE